VQNRLGRQIQYNFWQPITAIRKGDQDGSGATERDAGWQPLNATPMHPEYPSHAGSTPVRREPFDPTRR